MAMNTFSTAVRDALANAFAAEVDGGAGAGLIEIYTAGFAVLLATLTFSDPAFGAGSVVGVLTADAITDDASADATGTAAVGRLRDSVPTDLVEFTVGTAGSDINFNTVAWTLGDVISISAMTITFPAS